MTKFKHNKKRNTAFLYEAIILELTKCILREDMVGKKKIMKFIKESFSPRTLLYQDLKLYHALSKTKNVSLLTAEKILAEVKQQHKIIDKKTLISEQNKFTRHIKKYSLDNTLSNFVPSYKLFATISQIFNEKASIKTKVLLENEIVGRMSSKTLLEKKMVPIDNLIFKTFAKKFNNEYSNELLSEQKELLAKYVSSFSENGLELKLYLNEEIGRLRKTLEKSLLIEEFVEDDNMRTKAQKVLSVLESYKNKAPDKEMIRQVIKIQSLVGEIRTDGN